MSETASSEPQVPKKVEETRQVQEKTGTKRKRKNKPKKELTEEQKLLLSFGKPKSQPPTKKPKPSVADLPAETQMQIDRQKKKTEKEIEQMQYSYTKKNPRAQELYWGNKKTLMLLHQAVKRDERKKAKPRTQDFIRPNIPSWLSR
eukprot:TRINITY_DN66582_c11_g5_i1.p1 TRINITY_DN66582_c11_g5~~TRINITY_DN66582_c11_g5_i1.p1  ORF type:complete len:155 (+),score=11.08 TRINITY_DN66582_c11_g5_i1:29-466(+)